MRKLLTVMCGLLLFGGSLATTGCDGWSARMDSKNAMMLKKKKKLDSLQRLKSQQWIEENRRKQQADSAAQDSLQKKF